MVTYITSNSMQPIFKTSILRLFTTLLLFNLDILRIIALLFLSIGNCLAKHQIFHA